VQEFAGREAEFKAMLNARGLQLAALYSDDNGYDPGSEAETIERNLEIARFLQALGADILVYDPGRPRPDPALPEHFDVVAHTVNEIARASHDMGVTTAIHPHWQALIQERDDVTRIFDMVDTKYAKLTVDPSHMVKVGYDRRSAKPTARSSPTCTSRTSPRN
jgi:sugar phosphate isomerase/epimerase